MNPDIGFLRAERLDAEAKAGAVFEQTGIRLVVEGPCSGGEVGAAYVCWPDGRRAVLKWRPHYTVAALEAGPLAVQVGRDDVPGFALYLRDDGPGYCLHEPLRRFNTRSAELERRISKLADSYPARLPGYSAVHSDFHPGNILAADGEITGVVDWDGSARGDHRFDLIALRHFPADEVERWLALAGQRLT